MIKTGTLLLFFLLTACTAKYDIVRDKSKQLSMDQSFYVSQPKDGYYGEINYKKSGAMTRDAFYNELAKLEVQAEKEEGFQGKETSLANAKAKGFDILMFSTILHWEDRATEWSGKRDRANIKIELIDTQTESIVDSTLFNLVGTWWTFGGLHPQDMVNETTEAYFQQLFEIRD